MDNLLNFLFSEIHYFGNSYIRLLTETLTRVIKIDAVNLINACFKKNLKMKINLGNNIYRKFKLLLYILVPQGTTGLLKVTNLIEMYIPAAYFVAVFRNYSEREIVFSLFIYVFNTLILHHN